MENGLFDSFFIAFTKMKTSSHSDQDTQASKKTHFVHLGFCVLYVGSSFRGLQLQTHSPTHETVEGTLLQALKDAGLVDLSHGKIQSAHHQHVTRSCRTDRGVHAIRNLVAINVRYDRVEAAGGYLNVTESINRYLPRTVRVATTSLLTSNFFPRHVCSRRVYRYLVPLYAFLPRVDSWEACHQQYTDMLPSLNAAAASPSTSSICNAPCVALSKLAESFSSCSWMTEVSAAVEKSNELLERHVVGSHRFHNFSADYEVRGTVQLRKLTSSLSDESVRLIQRCEVLPALVFLSTAEFGPTLQDYCDVKGMPSVNSQANHFLPYLVFQIEGTSFLFNMIRKIVGTLIATAGRGTRETVWDELLSPSTRGCAPLAPGSHLYLALSMYSGYDRSVAGSKSYHPIREEWGGTVAAQAEAFAWGPLASEVVDADINRLPPLDHLVDARQQFLNDNRPQTIDEDSHLTHSSKSSQLTTAPPVSEMTRFLRSLRIHNWQWATVDVPAAEANKASGTSRKRSRSEASDNEGQPTEVKEKSTFSLGEGGWIDGADSRGLPSLAASAS